MKWKASLEEGYVKKIPPNIIRAKSLLKSAEQAIASALKIKVEIDSLKTVLRELYEGFHQYGEALGYQRGYKFSSHEAIKYFLEEVLKEETIAAKFDRYRKLRNGINYYGDEVSEEAVQEARKEIPVLIEKLKKHLLIDKEKETEKKKPLLQTNPPSPPEPEIYLFNTPPFGAVGLFLFTMRGVLNIKNTSPLAVVGIFTSPDQISLSPYSPSNRRHATPSSQTGQWPIELHYPHY